MKVTVYDGDGTIVFENVEAWHYLNGPGAAVAQAPNGRVVFINENVTAVEVEYEPGDGPA